MDPLEALREAIRQGRYELTLHAVQEAAEDGLHVVDVESAILTGTIIRTEEDPVRGHKHIIEGFAADLSTRIGVVARFQPTGTAVIITVYEMKTNA